MSTTPTQLPEETLTALDDALVAFRRFWSGPALKERFLAELGEPVTPTQYMVVRAVAGAGTEPCVGDVAAELNIDASTASRFVADAVDAGFLDRTQSTEDRRRSVLRLTRAGRRLLERGASVRRRLLAEVTTGWPPRDVQTLTRLLDRVSRGADGGRP